MQLDKMVRRFMTKGMRPFMNELKTGMCMLGMGTHTFPVDDFADVAFRCKSLREIKLTTDFGYEKSALGAFLFMLNPNDVVWDIGAAFGLFAIHSASMCKNVVAFEPDPAHFERLQANVRWNSLNHQVSLQQIALSDSKGNFALVSDGLTGVSPSLAPTANGARTVTVATDTVDNLIDGGLPTPNVLKIDVEGAEAQVLRGATDLLSSETAPRVIFVEVHPQFLPQFGDIVDDVHNLIQSNGYTVICSADRKEQFHILAINA